MLQGLSFVVALISLGCYFYVIYQMFENAETQGNRTLSRLNCGINGVEDLVVPAGAESLAADVLFEGSVALQDVEC